MKSFNECALMIKGRRIGTGFPVYVVAELSANHHHDFEKAVQLVHAAKHAGADAIKLQTYTPDTITIDCDRDEFRIGKGSIWAGRTLYDLYREAYMPWEWHEGLIQEAEKLGLDWFSSPFDLSAVRFLESLNAPVYKIASFENIDLPLIQNVAKTGKPIIISTGLASLFEIDEAVTAARDGGCEALALLKCTSAYPATVDGANLRTIPHLAERFRVPVGLSDHTLGLATAVAAVSLGACIVEKHLILDRNHGGPDSAFSFEPPEFRTLVDAVREVEKALGSVSFEITDEEAASKIFRRSLFVVKDMQRGEIFTEENIRSIRPGCGLPPKHYGHVLGKKAAADLSRGTPLKWSHIE